MKKNSGFTLIELLVVMSIIALLASLLVSGIVRAKEQTRTKATKALIEKILNALEEYKSAYYAYPPSEGDYPGSKALYHYLGTQLDKVGGYDPTTGDNRKEKFGPAVLGGFAKTEISDEKIVDLWGTELTYKNPGTDHSNDKGKNNTDVVDIESWGSNQKEDADDSSENDDINNWKLEK
ncbi:MAG: prepilin-type N-terminal cleavage/methylation domain-containing protein [Planctomycetota bacterium]